MDKRQREATGADFRRIASQHIGPSVGATADELWAARCGLLHCYAAESRLSREKPQVMKLVYKYGHVKQTHNVEGWVMIDLDKLIDRLVKAMASIRRKIEGGELDPILVGKRLTMMFNPVRSSQMYQHLVRGKR
ncbi:MAG TPA: hypothetical protein VMX94_02025 [Armatimonadota bacterium]|nr:hypothetical protein [Armatimonadota bacterium]